MQAKTITKCQVLCIDSLKSYVDSMQMSLREVETFFSQSDLQQIHELAKREAISKV